MKKIYILTVIAAGLAVPVSAKNIKSKPLPASVYTVSGGITVKAGTAASPVITIANADADKCSVSSNTEGGTLYVELRSSGTAECAGSVMVELAADTPLRLKSRTGAIAVSGISGEIKAYTQGSVTLNNVSGNLSVDGGNGDVTGTVSSPKVTIKTQSGKINLSGLKGTGSLMSAADITAKWIKAPASGEMLVLTPENIAITLPKGAAVKTTVVTNGKTENAFAKAKGKFSLLLQMGKQITVTEN